MTPSRDKLFLSHSADDKPMVKALAVALEALNQSVWFDAEQVGAGQSIAKAVEKASLPPRG